MKKMAQAPQCMRHTRCVFIGPLLSTRRWCTVVQVADFGLAVKMDHMETHMSNAFQVGRGQHVRLCLPGLKPWAFHVFFLTGWS
jgi:hypothetical protein